jgi:hypothetical protein
MSKIIKICSICNKEFESYKSQNRQVCSKKCRLQLMSRLLKNIIKVERITKFCKQCKKEFIVPRYKKNQIYCSLKCKYDGQDSSHLLKFAVKKGQVAWNKGKKHPAMAERMKTGIYLICDFCQTRIYIPKWRISRTKYHFCSQSCNNKFRVGEKGRNYINGSSFIDYPIEFNKELKDKIKQRDGHYCVLCGINEKEHKLKYNKKLTIHHIDYNKKNCKEDNLITLCLKHNCNANKRKIKRSWIQMFKTIINLQKGILD